MKGPEGDGDKIRVQPAPSIRLEIGFGKINRLK
jgi:hypothetical protein